MNIHEPVPKIPYKWGTLVHPLGKPETFPPKTPSITHALHPESDGPLVAEFIAKKLSIPREIAQVIAQTSKEITAVNDVFHDPNDVDAKLTVDSGHLNIPVEKTYADPALLPYIAELLCNLRDDQLLDIAEIIEKHRTEFSEALSTLEGDDEKKLWAIIPQAVRERIKDLLTYTDRINLNNAARNQSKEEHDLDHGERQKNGPDYYVAVTDTGIEFSVTSLSILSYVRDRIVAIFRIPDGVAWPIGEQFRSRKVALASHTHPHGIKKVWVKEEGNETGLATLIPAEERDPHIAYIDSFNNRRVRVHNLKAFWECVQTNKTSENTVYIQVGSSVIECFVGTNLTSGPGGQYTIYLNPADHDNGGGGNAELTRRLDDGAPIQGTWEPEGAQNPSTKLRKIDRVLGTIVCVLPPEEGKRRWAEQNQAAEAISQPSTETKVD